MYYLAAIQDAISIDANSDPITGKEVDTIVLP